MTHRKNIGNEGEKIAAAYLIEKGFTIEATNWKYKYWEIDIVASYNNKLHFVEVKTRSTDFFGQPEAGITNAKLNAMKKAAQAYWEQHAQWQQIQLDVIAIVLPKNAAPEISYFPDVF
ncbi:MAG: YraN family protein [Chitinophagaceae bacterium]